MKEQQVTGGKQLLQAREEALAQVKYGSIKPHGKLFGMDTFTWCNPDMHVLSVTLQSFPFPVHLMGAKQMFDALVDLEEMCSNVNAMLAIDDSTFALETVLASHVPYLLGCVDMSDAFQIVQGIQLHPGVLVFAAVGDQAEIEVEKFIEQVALHRV